MTWDGQDRRNGSHDAITDIREVVIELKGDFHNIAKAQMELNESVKQLVDIQTKQELLKQEVAYKHNTNVVAIESLKMSITETNNNCKSSKAEFEVYKSKLKPIEFLLDNPKLGFILILSIYLFAIDDIRVPILNAFGINAV